MRFLPVLTADRKTNGKTIHSFIATAAARMGYSLLALLDTITQATARALGKVSRVHDAGAFWVPQGRAFVDCWREESARGGGSLTLRLGRLELVADYR